MAKGFNQTFGIDYTKTFAPMTKLNTIQIILSIAANLDRPLHQLDAKNAFLNGDIEEEVYMNPPLGFEQDANHKVCRLKKSPYGLKQSPCMWFDRFSKFLKKHAYVQGQANHTLFIKISPSGKRTILIVYVDDIILTGDDFGEMEKLREVLGKEFEIKDLGQLKYFLGIEVARSKDGIFVSQREYTIDLLKETGMLGCRPASSNINPTLKFGKEENGTPVDKGSYQRLFGRLIYLSYTKPDLAFAINVVNQFMHSP